MKIPESLLDRDYNPDPSHRKKKHAVWILQKYPPRVNAGAEWTAHTLNLFLLEKGWSVVLITHEFPRKEMEGVRVLLFDQKEDIQLALQEASVILSHNKFSELAVVTGTQLGIDVVLCQHGDAARPFLRQYLHKIPRKQLHLLHNSKWIERFYSDFHLDSRVLFPPIDKRKFQFTTNRTYIALINCSKDKGGELLVKLAKAMPEYKFLGVIGSYGEQVIERHIPNLTYMENTPEFQRFFSQIGILLIPSLYESWGRVGVEAMMLGIPVIASPTPGLRESLGPAGLFANRENVWEWMKLIKKLKEDPWFYTRKSMEGQIRAGEVDRPDQLEDVERWLASL